VQQFEISSFPQIGVGAGRNWSVSGLFDRAFWLGDLNYRIDAKRPEVPRAPSSRFRAESEQVKTVNEIGTT